MGWPVSSVNRRLAIFILLVNLFATAAGLWPFRPRHRHPDTMNVVELKHGLTAYLASVTTPAEMQARGAEMAELMISAKTLVDGSHVLLYRTLRYIVMLGGFNVLSIGAGMWLGRGAAGVEHPA